jgi:hypothetical protein
MEILKLFINIFKILSALLKPRDKKYYRKAFQRNSLVYRVPTKDELYKISSEWQSGLELIGWHYLPSRDEMTSKINLDGINAVIHDYHNKKIKFPYSGYKNIYDLDYVLGFVYGDIFVKEFNWEWIYLIIKNDNQKWAIISPNKKLIIRTNRIFVPNFKNDNSSFDFIGLYKQIKLGKLRVGRHMKDSDKILILN